MAALGCMCGVRCKVAAGGGGGVYVSRGHARVLEDRWSR